MKNQNNEKLVYEVEEVRELLNMGRTSVYEYIRKVYKEKKPFHVVKIGNSYRISKQSFDKWINGDI